MDLALAFEDAEPFRLTVDQYRSLDDSGAFQDSQRVELIEGMIACLSPQASVHTTVAFELAVRLREKLREIGSPFTAVTTPTVAMPPHNALDPDVGVVRPRAGRDKKRLYARTGIPEYWVVDVKKLEVHRFASPTDGAYRAEPPIPLAGDLQSLTMPDLTIDGSGIL